MISEKMMEDAISSEPEKYLGEAGLTLVARQYSIGSYIFDLVFEDRRGAKLIVELQRGTLDRTHTYKILDYYDEYKENNPKEFIELMVIANRIPHERRRRLEAHGISWKEIPESEFSAQVDLPRVDTVQDEEFMKTGNKALSKLIRETRDKKDKINDINIDDYFEHLRKYNDSSIVEGVREFINKMGNDKELILRFKKGGRRVELNLNICINKFRPNNTFVGLTSSERGFFAWPWFKLLKDYPAETKVREIFGEKRKAYFNIKPNNLDELKELFNKIEESIRVIKESC